MTQPMIETALALITAHLLADFVVQTLWIVENKRRFPVLLWHGSHVFALSVLALGGSVVLALVIAAAHMVIDLVKVRALPPTLWAFCADQMAHLVTIALVVWWVPDAFAQGLWHPLPTGVFLAALYLCGFILTTTAGGPIVGLLMAPYRDLTPAEGLDNAGRTIGLLERGLIYLLVMAGEPAGIGFLIAAKSILRFDTASKSQKLSEYVIIGTLASFGWALLMAFGTQALIKLLA